MRRLAIADIHLTGYEEDTIDNEGLPLRLGVIVKTFNFVIKKAKELRINKIDILGDLIHDKSIIYTTAQDAFKELLLQNLDIQFTILAGNHDFSAVSDKIQKCAISVFSGYKNVKVVINKPLVDGNITLVPYFSNFLEVLKNIQGNSILLTHIGLNEAMLQSGLSKIDKIKLSDLRKFKLVLSGHYHKPQQIQNENTKFYYVGGFSNHSWNDKNEQKRFLIYDDKTLEVESINMENQPEYKEYIIDDINTAKDILKEAEIQKNKGNYVRIRKNIKEDIEIPHDIFVIEHKDINVTDRGINIVDTLKEKLQKYLTIKKIKNEDQEEYIKILQKYSIIN